MKILSDAGTSAGFRARIGELFDAALELEPADRATFLDRECAGDPTLRAETESLLAAHRRPGILDRPAVLPLPEFEPAGAPDMTGQTVAHYRIERPLGHGGMGAVYRAHDLRLRRDVALKFLPAHWSGNSAAKQRFLHEARSAAALDHPNICVIHDVAETAGGQPFIAMACYDGETLKQRIARGRLPVVEALDVAMEVARGLEAADAREIVHRDIKPGNLMLAEGGLRIVDFGIAQAADVAITGSGMIRGTVAYMSPEQTRGERVDRRTDLWSLGVVLFEMIVGERPFTGEHDVAVLRAIDATPPPLHALRAVRAAPLAPLLKRLLAKRAADRYATAGELLADLERIRAAIAGGEGAQDLAESSTAPTDPLAAEGERRLATIVVCHLSGYTDLIERLDPAATDRILEQLRMLAAEVAAAHDGDLDRAAGDELALRFGIPTAREDDALRATQAALELVERMRALAAGIEADGGPPLRPHIGIGAGPVIVQPGDAGYRIAGTVVRTAALLAEQAQADEVWVGPELQRIVAPFFVTQQRPPLTIPGSSQLLEPRRIVGPSGSETRMEAASKLGLTAFTGRDAELAELRASLEHALIGEGALVTLIGEAGMGKSRLMHELGDDLETGGVTVLRGRCQSYGSDSAYLPFIELLRAGLLDDAGPGDARSSVEERVRALEPELQPYLPFYLHLLSLPAPDLPLPRHLQGEQFRLAIQDALAAWLTVWSRRRPVVVLLEDWHWADAASHATLKQLAELAATYALLLVVSSRPDSVTDWGVPGRHRTITLGALEPAASIAILKSVLKAEAVSGELGTRLHERTGGNPFFLEEICQTLVEEGRLRVERGGVVPSGPIETLELPDTVQAVIRARLDRIAPRARETLRRASVIGREFTRELLEQTVGMPGHLPHSLQTLKAAGLIQQMRVVPESAYRFKHVLTQEVAYGSLLERQRRELHGRVGAAIEAVHAGHIEEHLERLVHHFSRSESWSKAVHYAIRAAERADMLSQFSEAVALLDRAEGWLARLPDTAEREDARVDILLRQERLCETLGERKRQERIIDELIALLEARGGGPRLAEAYLRRGDLSTLTRRYDMAEDALLKSLRIRRETGDVVGERNTLRSLGLLRWHERRNEEALEFIGQALRIDRERDDVVAIVGDLSNLGYVLKGTGDLTHAREHLEEGVRIAEPAAAASGGASEITLKLNYLLHNLANLHREEGNVDRALSYLHRAQRIALDFGLPVQLSYHCTALAHIHLQQGRIEESLVQYREAIELTRRAAYVPGLAQSLRFLGEVLMGLDRHDEALPHLEEAARLFSQLGDPHTEASMCAHIGVVCERRSDFAAALAAWARARALRQETGDAAGELEALEGLARVTRRHVDEPSFALEYYAQALALAQSLNDAAAQGRLHNSTGILAWSRGAYTDALAHYEAALELYGGLGDNASAGLMRNSIGVTLRALGRTDDAIACLEDAVARHRHGSYALLEGHALSALAGLWEMRGELASAQDCYTRSLELRRASKDRRGEGWMLCGLARVQQARGETAVARDSLAQATAIARECGDAELADACERLRRAPGP